MSALQWLDLTGKRDGRFSLAVLVLALGGIPGLAAAAEVISVEALQFSRVQLLGSNELEVRQGGENTLKVRGDSGDLKPPPFVVEGDTLRLGITAEGESVRDLQFKLTATELKELQVQGSGEAYVKPLDVGEFRVLVEGSGEVRMFDVKASDFEIGVSGSGAVEAVNVRAASARLNLKGSGDIDLGSIEADTIKANLAGSGDVSVQGDGSTGELSVGMMGSGDVRFGGVAAKRAKVTLMGSGDIEIGMVEALEVEIFGSGDLVYSGEPTISRSIIGSGGVTRRDGK